MLEPDGYLGLLIGTSSALHFLLKVTKQHQGIMNN